MLDSRLHTQPFDLTAFAQEHTGPLSWSAHPEAETLARWALAEHDGELGTPCWHVDISVDDVARVLASPSERARAVLGPRGVLVLACVNGMSCLGSIADALELSAGEVVAIVDRLCVLGLVELDRSARADASARA